MHNMNMCPNNIYIGALHFGPLHDDSATCRRPCKIGPTCWTIIKPCTLGYSAVIMLTFMQNVCLKIAQVLYFGPLWVAIIHADVHAKYMPNEHSTFALCTTIRRHWYRQTDQMSCWCGCVALINYFLLSDRHMLLSLFSQLNVSGQHWWRLAQSGLTKPLHATNITFSNQAPTVTLTDSIQLPLSL